MALVRHFASLAVRGTDSSHHLVRGEITEIAGEACKPLNGLTPLRRGERPIEA